MPFPSLADLATSGVPADGFPTVDELRDDLMELSRAHPDRITASVIGRSRLGDPIHLFTIAGGERSVVVAAGVHPNEPIGFRTIQHLARVLIADPDTYGFDATWHLVPCIDPDGTRLNEGWFAAPLRRDDYYRGFYRPAPDEQVEWSFPFSYRGFGFDAPIPETSALMELFDRVHPDVFVGLHNGEFGGVYFYTNEADTVLARELSAIPARFGLPLDVGEPEIAGLDLLADAVFRAPLTREQIDRRIALGLAEPRAGGAGTADYLERFGTTTMIAELPYWVHPDAADTTDAGTSYRAVLTAKAAALEELHDVMTGILDSVRGDMTIDSPFRRASEAFALGMGSVAAAERVRIASPESDRPATVAEVFGNAEVVRTFRLRFGGILRRALAAEVHAGTASPLVRVALTALTGRWEDWLAADPHAQLAPAPLNALVGVQLAALFATVRRRVAEDAE